ncbi:hypothetical protein EDB84DRAFT_1572184 [Lactarius hengduanensis]|nr:hypothetical protein EDB84DRAFT_1572184 [Lactarius hengduanensis]
MSPALARALAHFLSATFLRASPLSRALCALGFPALCARSAFPRSQLQRDAFPTLAATYTKFRAAPKRARPFPTTCDPPTPFPLPDLAALARGTIPSTATRPATAAEHIYDTARPAEACATACDASHPQNPARIIDRFPAIRDGLVYYLVTTAGGGSIFNLWPQVLLPDRVFARFCAAQPTPT